MQVPWKTSQPALSRPIVFMYAQPRSCFSPAIPGLLCFSLVLIVFRLVTQAVVAGAGQAGAVEDTPSQVPEQLLALNSVAPLRLTQALLPFWLPKQGMH